MKNKLLFLYILLLSLSACTKHLTSLNDDSKSSGTATGASLFLQGELDLAYYYVDPSDYYNPFREFAQTWSPCTYVSNARYQLTSYNPQQYWWDIMYTGTLSNLQRARTYFKEDVSDTSILHNDLIIDDILQVYTYDLLLNTYGDIPYSEAENDAIVYPKYDTSLTIYKDLIYRLDTCIARINTGSTAMGSADQIYSGSASSWKKFAATLKLKLALLYADKDLSYSTTKVKEAVASGVFTSSSDNALFTFDASTSSYSSPIWYALVESGRHDYCPTDIMIDTLKSWNDPRLALCYTKAPDSTYTGGIPGAGNSYSVLSKFADQLLTATYPADLLDYSETEFLLAEAAARGIDVGSSAETYYNAAVTASIEFWGGTASEASTYLTQTAVNWNTATGTYKEKIGWQKWISLMNRGWDAWLEIRRLGYPNIDEINPPYGASGDLPLRYPYPTIETSSNTTNVNNAIADMGGTNLVSTKLFWMN